MRGKIAHTQTLYQKKKFYQKSYLFYKLFFVISIIVVNLLISDLSARPVKAPVPKNTPVQTQGFSISKSDMYLSVSDYTTVMKRLQSILDKTDPKAAITELVKLSNSYQSVFNSCHTVAHALGRVSYQKYNDFTEAMQYQDDFCGSGYVHGVIEAKFKTSLNIYADLQIVCPSVNAGGCYHGVGHGLMYFTSNDLKRALSLCNTYNNYTKRLRCSEGAFMENFSTDLNAHPSAFLHPDNPAYPCETQIGVFKSVCYFYTPVYYLSLHQHDFAEAINWCKTVERPFISSCINGVGSRTMKQNMSDPLLVEKICTDESGQYISSCIDGMVGYYVVNFSSWKKGKELCNVLNPQNKSTCTASVNSRKYMFLN